MTPDLQSPGSVRSAADCWNEQIRAFWQRLGGRLPTAAERVEYERLVVEWNTADRAKAA